MAQHATTSPQLSPRRRSALTKPTHIVGIGASAGGLSALEEFFDHMPSDSGMAFVVIQHLSPDFKSLMDDLLARHTEMAIHRVTDGTVLRANSIYLIPPKSHMTVSRGKLFLTAVKSGQQTDLPIDVFLHSLAEYCGEKAAAVILSGTGTDGSRGIKSIRQAGGLVLVQAIESAQFDGMPRSAIASGCCDLMLAPGGMPDIILHAARLPAGERSAFFNQYLETDPSGEHQQVFAILKSHYNLDFAKYKPSTVGRRIQRRMDLARINTQSEYVAHLASDVNELHTLYHDLLIGVTEFFRDRKAFRLIEEKIIPEIFENRAPDQDIRIWSAGCATGEEAYSLGILFAEKAQEYHFQGNITVFATDVHRKSLEAASHGQFGRDRLGNVSAQRLERFFERVGSDRYQVSPALRKMIVFAPHNLINDPPFTRMDLVCCRNLLIYLQSDIQAKVLSLFHFALKINGVLFLGPSEGLGKISPEFIKVDHANKVFRKLRELNLAVNMNFDSMPARFSAPAVVPVAAQKTVSLDRQLLNDYDFLLREYMPAGMLVDERRRLLHNFGDLTGIMRPGEGRFENDILAMVVEPFKIPLTTALHRAAKTHEQVTTYGLSVEHEGARQRYDLTVKYIGHRHSEGGHFFITLGPSRQSLVEERSTAVSPLIEQVDVPLHLQQRILDLEVELQATKESLQTSVEELQTANEELQTTNEELMAANEELQSTNEELHSVNEELYTVNAEFEDKNRELKTLNQDHVQLLHSVDVGIVYVDQALKIRKFNPAVEKIFKLLPQDIGRPIDHIAYHLANQAQMLMDVQLVLKTGQRIAKEVCTDDGQWLLKRMLPFRTEGGEVGGVILTFTDISAVKNAEQALARHARELEEKIEERTLRLREAKDAADRANRAKSSFLANMSHEIRTPMSGILMAAELLEEMGLSSRQADLVKTMQRGARNLNDILDDILDHSKIEAGKVDLYREPLLVADIVNEVIELYRPKISEKQLRIETSIAPEVPEMLLGDPVRLKQILVNLVSNAVKFTERGGITVGVESEKITPCNCILRFQVSDTGIGIAEESLANIFEPFAQGDSSLTRKYGGTGLGLSISRQLVELMGGKLWLEPAAEGASFYFNAVFDLLHVPRRRHKAVAEADTNPLSAATVCKVLLAEDDAMNRDLIAAMMHKIGCQLRAVANGREAVAALQEQAFDLVLMDISMPVMDGLAATARIRQFPQEHMNYEVPVVALTAHAIEEDVNKFIGAGMAQVLTKPLSGKTLKEVIRVHCQSGRSRGST